MSPQIKFALACATVVLTAEVLASATATLNWTLSDGKVVTETQELQLFADGVFRTTYSNGERIIVNYNDTPATVGGVEIPSMSAKLVLTEAKNNNKDQVQ